MKRLSCINPEGVLKVTKLTAEQMMQKTICLKKKKSNFNKQGEDLLSKISSIFSVFMNFSESICF